MNEKALQILEQYDLRVVRKFGGRGAIMLETEQGLKMLKEFSGSKRRLALEQILLERLETARICKADRVVKNRDGELVSVGEYEVPWIVKNWPAGKECDTRSEEDLLRSMRLLGRIHREARGVWNLEEAEGARYQGEDRRVEFDKHNRELKRVQNFMRSKRKKGDFELLFLKHAERVMQDGRRVLNRLEESGYGGLLNRAREEEHICHGEYIHHNILINRQETTAVNFQRWEINVQVNDMAVFLRKIMEKQNWNEFLAGRMLEAYEQERPLSKEERIYLALCLSYPEKVWKLAHHYYHTNKAWIPEKSTEKLERFLEQEELRSCMLRSAFGVRI